MAGKKTASKKKKNRRKKKKDLPQISIGWKEVLGICCVLVLFVAWPHLGKKFAKGESVPQGDYDYCLDISHYQGKIQWDSLKIMVDGAGRTVKDLSAAREVRPISYVYIKATEGESLKDKHFDSYWKSAGKTDIWRGAYHFYRSSKDPEKQARFFIKTVGKMDNVDLPPVLDVETMHDGCSRKQLNNDILKWLQIVEEYYGVKPIIYTSDRYCRDVLSPGITSRYKIWVAHYKTKSPWTDDWLMWQFTENALVCGVKGKTDLSVIRCGEMLR